MQTHTTHPATYPPVYWRHSKKWRELLGKTASVVVGTVITTPPPSTAKMTPYWYGVVEILDADSDQVPKKVECMGVTGEVLEPGDTVQFVLRRVVDPDPQGIIAYGLKVTKVVR